MFVNRTTASLYRHSSRPSSPERSNSTDTPYLDPHKKQLQVQAFFAQKCYRARVVTSLRVMVILVVMLVSIALSWVIGYLQYSYACELGFVCGCVPIVGVSPLWVSLV